MISLNAALKIMADLNCSQETEPLDLTRANCRVTAEDVVSDIHMPPFNKSAMDGYACRKEDLDNILEVIEVIKPGEVPAMPLRANQCAKIMTGAMVPETADCVVIIEQTEPAGENRIRIAGENTSTNICLVGEDVKPGDLLLAKGIRLKSQHLAIMAAAGCARPVVYKQPQVGILSTGDELVEPQHTPGISQIRNSNAYQLISQIIDSGCHANYLGIVEDQEKNLKKHMLEALADNDVLILTGGVSMGDFDFVPKVLEEIGMEILFSKLAIQPGKPIVFARNREKSCFGLSGNPVSSFFQFELLVKPFLAKLTGRIEKPVDLMLPLGVDYAPRASDRERFFPVKITGQGTVIPVEFHGSAHLQSLAQADGIASMPSGQNMLKKGTVINVRSI